MKTGIALEGGKPDTDAKKEPQIERRKRKKKITRRPGGRRAVAEKAIESLGFFARLFQAAD
jgi:hypothetical protein